MAVARRLDRGWQVEHGCSHGDFQRAWGKYSTLKVIIARRTGVQNSLTEAVFSVPVIENRRWNRWDSLF